jgi:hypothetical protein
MFMVVLIRNTDWKTAWMTILNLSGINRCFRVLLKEHADQK